RDLFAAGAEDGEIPEELVGAAVRALRDWPWEERPVGVVAMPSSTRPVLVASTAAAISRLGRLPMLGTLDLDPHIPRAETGGNSAFRLASVWGRFSVGPELATALAGIDGPVLLV